MPKWDRSLSQIPVSYPIKVLFHGFESDTVRLQQAGWEISARQCMDTYMHAMSVQLAMRNQRLRLHALTNVINLDGRMIHYVANDLLSGILEFYRSLHFEVVAIGPDVEMYATPWGRNPIDDVPALDTRPGAINYYPVDTRPQWVPAPQRFKLSELCLFRKVDGIQEVFIEKASVDDLMNMILKKQAPKQKEIREKIRRDEFKKEFESFQERGEIKAQLIVAG